jgi:signal transduction histidine kinase
VTKSQRTIIASGALSLLAGISSLVSTAAEPRSDLGSLRIIEALGFAVSGLGLIALTRQKERGRLLARTAVLLLGFLAMSGLTLIGLHAVSVRPYTTAIPARPLSVLPGSELDLLLFLGFLAIAIALFALTLVGRKRAGASMAASLAVTVGVIGLGSFMAVALHLQAPDSRIVDTLPGLVLFPTIGIGLFYAANRELGSVLVVGSDRLSNHHLCAATGACLGLVALGVFLVFSLTAREGDELAYSYRIDRFRDALGTTQMALKEVDEHVRRASMVDLEVEPASFKRAVANLEESLQQLGSFASLPEYRRHLLASITRVKSTVVQQVKDHSDPAARALAVDELLNASAGLTQGISRLTRILQSESENLARKQAHRRRGAAVVLSASAVAMVVLLGAIHLLFQRDSVARHRSEAALRRHNETLKGFAHTVAHDLRAPLRGIAGYASELDGQAHLVDSRGRHCITQINTAAHNLERLIGDTLDYAQLDAETPNLSTIALPALVAALLQQRAPEIRQHGTVIDTHFGIVTVRSWERGIVQIVGNLLDNAIKYSRNAHPPRLRIETAQTPLSWRLVIYDNGIGFDMKYHDRIFGLFQRLVTTDEFEGTGAGLAIVRKITDRLGGTVRAEGRPGGGATFLVELPRILNSELT